MNAENPVLVVGAGPVGLTLAADLARHGLRPRIIDRAAEPSPFCRAIGVTPRTLEIWEAMGVVRPMIESGIWLTGMRSCIAGMPPQEIEAPDLGLPYGQLGVPQSETERILTEHLSGFGIEVERGTELTGLAQNAYAVTAELTEQDRRVESQRFRYIVGCDGAHSTVRHALGIAFEGDAYPWPFMLGDVRIDWDLPYGRTLRALRLREGGPPDIFVAIPLPEPGRYRVSMLAPPDLAPAGGTGQGTQAELPGPALAQLQAVADNLLPMRPRLSDCRWSSIFRISLRLAARYRQGRVFLAGDAAHIHPPTGGQGMNTGIGDAHNLAWKLARVLRGTAPEALLDSYEPERRRVGAEVVARTRAASESYGREGGGVPDRRADAQVDISYRDTPFVEDEAGQDAAGPRAGDRVPDVTGLRQRGIGHRLRLFEALHGTSDVILTWVGAEGGDDDLAGLSAFARDLRRQTARPLRFVVVTASPAKDWAGIQILCDAEGRFGAVFGEDKAAFLVRPDGHVAWRGRACGTGLARFLERA